MNVVSVDGGKEDEKEYILNILSRKNEREKEREKERERGSVVDKYSAVLKLERNNKETNQRKETKRWLQVLIREVT